MNNDLKIGLVVSASVIACLFFVTFTTPSFGNKAGNQSSGLINDNSGAINLKIEKNKEKSSLLEEIEEDDFSLEYVTVGDDDNNNKVESEKNEDSQIIVEKLDQKIVKDEVVENEVVQENLGEDSDIDEKSDIEEDSALIEVDQDKMEQEVIIPVEIEKEEKVEIKIPKEEAKESFKEPLKEDIIYTIKSGDTLSKIARFYYLDSLKHFDISKANNGLKSSNLKIGQKIKLPAIEDLSKPVKKPKPLIKSNLVTSDQDIIYQVKKGDIASIIIQKYYGSFKYLKDVKKANPKVNLSRLKIGQKLTLPGLGKNKN